jgi:hypothetical protein
MFEWELIYYYLKDNTNLNLFDLKNTNVHRLKVVRNYKG